MTPHEIRALMNNAGEAVLHYAPRGEAALREHELLGAQIANRIAQPGGLLELEALGRLAHVALQFGNVSVQLFLGTELRQTFRLVGQVDIICVGDGNQRHVERPHDALRRNAVLLVVSALNGAPAVGLVQRFPHRVGHLVGVKNGAAAQVTRATADGLDQRSRRTKEAFLVGIENRHQRDFRQVETFAQQIDADEHIELALAQIAQNLDALQRLDLRVHVTAANAHLAVVLGQVLGHALGQGGDQHPLILLRATANLVQQVVNLSLHRTHFHLGIDEASRANDLLHHYARRLGQFVRAGCRGNIHSLVYAMLEFLKRKGTIVERAGKAESVFDQVLFARAVAVPHAVQLRYRLVGFVDEQHVVARYVIQQRRRRFARQAPGKVARVVLDAVAVAHLLDHLEIEARALMNALRLDDPSLLLQLRFPPRQLFQDGLHRRLLALRLHHVVGLGIHRQARILLLHGSEQGIDLGQRFDFIAPQLDAIGVVVVGGKNFDDVAAHSEGPAAEIALGALVENFDQLADNVVALDLLSFFQEQQHAVIGFRRSQAVDAAHRRNNDAVATLEQRPGGRQPKLVEFVIDGRFLLDVNVARGNVGFGLVIVVIRDKVLDRIVGEERLELVVELRRQRLVMRQDQRGAIQFLDDLGHGEGLARSGNSQQHLVFVAIEDAARQRLDRLPLVALRLVRTD